MTIIEPGTRSPLEQWAVETKQVEVLPYDDGTERVVLTNGLPEGDEDREVATVARCQSGDGLLVATAMHALIAHVRDRNEASSWVVHSQHLSRSEAEAILRVADDRRALIATVEAVMTSHLPQPEAAPNNDATEG